MYTITFAVPSEAIDSAGDINSPAINVSSVFFINLNKYPFTNFVNIHIINTPENCKWIQKICYSSGRGEDARVIDIIVGGEEVRWNGLWMEAECEWFSLHCKDRGGLFFSLIKSTHSVL